MNGTPLVMAALHTLLALTYPMLIYFALGVTPPRVVALCALALFAVRLSLAAPDRLVTVARLARLPALALVGAILASALWNDAASLFLTPALVSFALLLAFGLSFRQPETVIETLARAQVGAVAGSRGAWALCTGCIAYVLLGLLFTCEFVYRRWRFRRYVGAPTDVLFRRIFPPNPP